MTSARGISRQRRAQGPLSKWLEISPTECPIYPVLYLDFSSRFRSWSARLNAGRAPIATTMNPAPSTIANHHYCTVSTFQNHIIRAAKETQTEQRAPRYRHNSTVTLFLCTKSSMLLLLPRKFLPTFIRTDSFTSNSCVSTQRFSSESLKMSYDIPLVEIFLKWSFMRA